ncbi:MAG: ribulose-phosphate 3-epimerase [Patescibacteria group bacterium]|nr:ribulose-phosphate 3-epimerase [Patescibacteria group bacterium]
MALVCPTILAKDLSTYQAQLKRVKGLAKRVQIDLTDGVFAPTKTVSLEEISWPPGLLVDLHLMYQDPTKWMRQIVQAKVHMVIVHAEADGNFVAFAKILRKLKVKVGVALLPETPASAIKPALEYIDHVLIFSGELGKFGGTADLNLLIKAQALKQLKPSLEIGWDGGVNENNIHLLAAGGIDVLNVGGAIQKASNPAAAYATLKKKLGK